VLPKKAQGPTSRAASVMQHSDMGLNLLQSSIERVTGKKNITQK